jgi:hypothetical protein
VGYLPESIGVNAEAEEFLLLEAVTRNQLMKNLKDCEH